MSEDQITYIVRGVALKIHTEYGPGMLEKIYEKLLVNRLKQEGLKVASQVAIRIKEQGMENEIACFADIIVEDKVILELKSVEKLHKVHSKQLLPYLKLTGYKVGLLINFNVEWILKEGIKRIVNNQKD